MPSMDLGLLRAMLASPCPTRENKPSVIQKRNQERERDIAGVSVHSDTKDNKVDTRKYFARDPTGKCNERAKPRTARARK